MDDLCCIMSGALAKVIWIGEDDWKSSIGHLLKVLVSPVHWVYWFFFVLCLLASLLTCLTPRLSYWNKWDSPCIFLYVACLYGQVDFPYSVGVSRKWDFLHKVWSLQEQTFYKWVVIALEIPENHSNESIGQTESLRKGQIKKEPHLKKKTKIS